MAAAASASVDRRVQRTRNALREALVSLLPERGWDDLSVQDVCERANVGRSTFYMHFRNKEELLAGGLSDLRRALLEQAPEGEPAPMPFLRGLIDHVDQNRRLFRSIIGRRSATVVQTRFRRMVLELVLEDLSRACRAGWRREAAAHYVAGALVETLAWWVEAKGARPADELERYCRQLVAAVVAQVEKPGA